MYFFSLSTNKVKELATTLNGKDLVLNNWKSQYFGKQIFSINGCGHDCYFINIHDCYFINNFQIKYSKWH